MRVAGRRIALALALPALALACGSGGSLTSRGIERESAQPLGTIDRTLPEGDLEQARQALRQDAFRREHRFLDAAQPGHLYRSVRIRQVEIDAGLWPVEDLYAIGGQLFSLPLSTAMGLGGEGPIPRRIHLGRRGGPDALSCTACHWRGGPAGAGDAADNAMLRGDGIHQSSTIARNPPSLVGAGIRQRLAQEMTAALQGIRDEAIARAAAADAAVRLPLIAKTIDFGFITADPDGDLDLREIEGIDPDLVLEPFGWKGTTAEIRDVVEDQLLIHHGLVSEHLAIQGDQERVGPFGGDDPDGDGVIQELTEGQVTALSVFVALQEVPTEQLPEGDSYLTALWAQGRADFASLGCASCHTPSLPLDSNELVIAHRYGGSSLRLDLLSEGAEPRITPDAEGDAINVRLYSDLRRHAMGPQLAEGRVEQGVPADQFITPPLWGLAASGPYLHDGRAATIEDAILLHGGEALDAREAYARLNDDARAPLRVFLTSLVRARRLVAH